MIPIHKTIIGKVKTTKSDQFFHNFFNITIFNKIFLLWPEQEKYNKIVSIKDKSNITAVKLSEFPFAKTSIPFCIDTGVHASCEMGIITVKTLFMFPTFPHVDII